MTGLRVFQVRQQQGSTGRWGTLANGRAISCAPVNTAWAWSSAGLATSAVPEERVSCDRMGISSGQVRWWHVPVRLAAMMSVLSLEVLQGRCYSIPVATTTSMQVSLEVTSHPGCRHRGQSWHRWNKHVWDHWATCWHTDSSPLISTARSQTTVTSPMMFWSTLMTLSPGDIFQRFRAEPNHRISIFLALSCRHLRGVPRTDVRDTLFDDSDDFWNVGRNATSEVLHAICE